MASNKKKIRKLFLKALSPLEMGKWTQTIDNVKIQEITTMSYDHTIPSYPGTDDEPVKIYKPSDSTRSTTFSPADKNASGIYDCLKRDKYLIRTDLFQPFPDKTWRTVYIRCESFYHIYQAEIQVPDTKNFKV
jgi:hypothetical protein